MEKKPRQRRPRVDPSKLDLTQLTGDENVSVINRETGKKITGAKAPPLRHLGQWLEKNPAFDIDGKWKEVVRAKVGARGERGRSERGERGRSERGERGRSEKGARGARGERGERGISEILCELHKILKIKRCGKKIVHKKF